MFSYKMSYIFVWFFISIVSIYCKEYEKQSTEKVIYNFVDKIESDVKLCDKFLIDLKDILNADNENAETEQTNSLDNHVLIEGQHPLNGRLTSLIHKLNGKSEISKTLSAYSQCLKNIPVNNLLHLTGYHTNTSEVQPSVDKISNNTSPIPVYEGKWKPMGNNIQTKWTNKVNPLNVWPEYPRPQLVRNNWINLNGLWDYAITEALESDQEPLTYDQQILVPFGVESSLSGVMRAVTPDQVVWYKTHFNVTLNSDEKLILNFGAVDYESHVFINGHTVGGHEGGYTRFSFDITKFLIGNKENKLVVKVIDKTSENEGQPIGKQRLKPKGIFYTSTTGIWQTVWMERVPNIYIKDLVITTDIDKEFITIDVKTNEPMDKIDIKIVDKRGVIMASKESANRINKVHLNYPKLWSPTDPYLYKIRIKAGNDSVTSYVAFRKIEIKKDFKGINRFFLNGKPIFMFGVLDQGFWPDGIYTPPTEEAMINDIYVAKKLGFNTIRKHLKVESDRWYYAADRLGVLVWQDFPSALGHINNNIVNPMAAKQIELEMKTMVKQLHNFPSIVMWVLFNDGWGQYDTPRIVSLIKECDPSRLIYEANVSTDFKTSDIADDGYYSDKNPTSFEIPLNPNKVVVNGGFGGGGLLIKDNVWETHDLHQYKSFRSPKELQKFFIDGLATVRANAMFGLGAAVYNQLTDIEGEINGLITYDRELFKVNTPDDISKQVQKLYPLESVETVIFDSGHLSDSEVWFYTTTEPTIQWIQLDYKDDQWSQGKAGFGTPTHNLTVRTEWKTSDIWLRKVFEIPENKMPAHPVLHIFYDESAQVYINGKLLSNSFDSYQTSYSAHDIDPNILNIGQNIIAIHCHQVYGGQGIDAGIYGTVYGGKGSQQNLF